MRSILLLAASLAVTGATASIQALLAWGERRPELEYNPKKIGELFADKALKGAIGPLQFERTLGALRERGFVTNEGVYSEVVDTSGVIVGQRKASAVQVLVDLEGARYSLRGSVRQGRWWFTSVQRSSAEGVLPSAEAIAKGLGFATAPKAEHIQGAVKSFLDGERVNLAAREAREGALKEDKVLQEMGVRLPPAPVKARVEEAIGKARELNAAIAALEAPAATATPTAARSAAKKAEKKTSQTAV